MDYITEIRKLQKNARNKLYRLRKKGIVNANIGASVVPVIPMAEVAGMSKREQMAYARELKRFNSRENKIELSGESDEYILQRNNVAISAPDVWDYRLAEARANIERQAVREQIELAREETYASLDLESALDFERYEIDPQQQADILAGGQSLHSRFQDLTPVIMREGFASDEAIRRATERQRKAISIINMKRNEKRYRDWRAGIVSRMVDNGYTEGAEYVADLTLEQMDWLRYYTDFTELTNTYLYQNDYIRGRAMASEDTLSTYEGLIIELVQQAKKIRSSYTL
jgi:hypothetical protein